MADAKALSQAKVPEGPCGSRYNSLDPGSKRSRKDDQTYPDARGSGMEGGGQSLAGG